MRVAREVATAACCVRALPDGSLSARSLAACSRDLEQLLRPSVHACSAASFNPSPSPSSSQDTSSCSPALLSSRNDGSASHSRLAHGSCCNESGWPAPAAGQALKGVTLRTSHHQQNRLSVCCRQRGLRSSSGGGSSSGGAGAGAAAQASEPASAAPVLLAAWHAPAALHARTLPLGLLLAPSSWLPLPLPAPLASAAAPPPIATAVGARRGLSAAGPSFFPQELQGCTTVQEVQDLVERHGRRMRPANYAEVVCRLGQLTYGSRSADRAAARRLAAQCTAAALAAAAAAGGRDLRGGDTGSRTGAGVDVLKVLLRGWGSVRKPPPELLARMLEALVPGSSAALGASAGPGAQQPWPQGPAVRQGYGRLHTATLRDAAELVEPLAALGALTPPLLEVLVNVAVRRAGNEAPAVVAAAAIAYGRAGVTDPRVAQAFLEAAVARRGGGGAAAAAAAAGHVAEALALCARAGWYDPRVFSEAADALVARGGVGALTLRQTWSVLRAFAGARHEHPLLLQALATHAKSFDFQHHVPHPHSSETMLDSDADAADEAVAPRPAFGIGSESEEAGARQSSELCANGQYGSTTAAAPPPLGSSSSRGRELTLDLNTLAGLVHGFSTAQVYDSELYDRLAAGAAALLREATAARLGESQPRALAAALTALLEGFAGVGVYPGQLLDAMRAQQQQPCWMRSMSVDQVVSLAGSLAALRHRDEALLDKLDAAAAVFLENAVSAATAAAAAAADASGGSPTAAAAAAAAPDPSWLPGFLDAVCRQLSYPCPRTVATLAAATAVRQRSSGRGAAAALRPLTKDEKRGGAAAAVLLDTGPRDQEVLSRLQLLLLLVRGGRWGRGGAAHAQAGQHWRWGRFDVADARGLPDPLSPQWVCQLAAGLACTGARLHEGEELALALALACSIERLVGAAAAAAEGAEAETVGLATAAATPARYAGMRLASAAAAAQPLTAAQGAAALDDAAACHLFRAVIASQDRWEERAGRAAAAAAAAEEEEQGEVEVEGPGAHMRVDEDVTGREWWWEAGGTGEGQGAPRGGLEAALHRALTPAVAAALLARAASAWHAAGLGTAAPRAPEVAVVQRDRRGGGAKRLRRGGGGGDTVQSPLRLSALLRSLGLPVFEQWVTSDGFFRVACGVVLPGGRKVGVEVLPDGAFAANSSSVGFGATAGGGDNSNSNDDGDDAAAATGAGSVGGAAEGAVRPAPAAVLIGDAAFRARCLTARGWRMVALPAGEWAAAEAAGPAACVALMSRHSGAL
ncbi:hypothetical protein PLESTB_001748600 [Pleodorina starrii]|uniref:RAP domain-containing protein n=1 Tax=Pleodorina starrii TaxID=330485 RepID=A0A9W6C0R4_9CHLO|nr:hypothetical protein PLESTM_000711300 [Pleodorina starrii]GLC61370.1 hypothetical protein PLESTB_001748600 [Pleodorina starrii]GLC67550.1 hypothetical protein PLESTF_000569800 [Pleodorina starrii]